MVLEALEQGDSIEEDRAECQAPDADEAMHQDRAVDVKDALELAVEGSMVIERS